MNQPKSWLIGMRVVEVLMPAGDNVALVLEADDGSRVTVILAACPDPPNPTSEEV